MKPYLDRLKRLVETEWVADFLRSAVVALGAAVLAAVFAMCLPLYYRSEAHVLPLDAKGFGPLGGMAAAAAALGVGVPQQEGPEGIYPEIIGSIWMRRNLLDSTFTYTIRRKPFKETVSETRTLRGYLGISGEDQSIRALGQIIQANRDTKTRLLTISAETRSPELSQQIVNRIIELLDTFLREKNQTRGKAKAAYTGARLNEARIELAAKEETLRRFLERNRNFLLSADPSTRLWGMRLESEHQLQKQLVSTLALNREQALLEEKNDLSLLNVMDEANLPNERSRPARSRIVTLVAALVFSVGFAWRRRRWIRQSVATPY